MQKTQAHRAQQPHQQTSRAHDSVVKHGSETVFSSGSGSVGKGDSSPAPAVGSDLQKESREIHISSYPSDETTATDNQKQQRTLRPHDASLHRGESRRFEPLYSHDPVLSHPVPVSAFGSVRMDAGLRLPEVTMMSAYSSQDSRCHSERSAGPPGGRFALVDRPGMGMGRGTGLSPPSPHRIQTESSETIRSNKSSLATAAAAAAALQEHEEDKVQPLHLSEYERAQDGPPRTGGVGPSGPISGRSSPIEGGKISPYRSGPLPPGAWAHAVAGTEADGERSLTISPNDSLFRVEADEGGDGGGSSGASSEVGRCTHGAEGGRGPRIFSPPLSPVLSNPSLPDPTKACSPLHRHSPPSSPIDPFSFDSLDRASAHGGGLWHGGQRGDLTPLSPAGAPSVLSFSSLLDRCEREGVWDAERRRRGGEVSDDEDDEGDPLLSLSLSGTRSFTEEFYIGSDASSPGVSGSRSRSRSPAARGRNGSWQNIEGGGGRECHRHAGRVLALRESSSFGGRVDRGDRLPHFPIPRGVRGDGDGSASSSLDVASFLRRVVSGIQMSNAGGGSSASPLWLLREDRYRSFHPPQYAGGAGELGWRRGGGGGSDKGREEEEEEFEGHIEEALRDLNMSLDLALSSSPPPVSHSHPQNGQRVRSERAKKISTLSHLHRESGATGRREAEKKRVQAEEENREGFLFALSAMFGFSRQQQQPPQVQRDKAEKETSRGDHGKEGAPVDVVQSSFSSSASPALIARQTSLSKLKFPPLLRSDSLACVALDMTGGGRGKGGKGNPSASGTAHLGLPVSAGGVLGLVVLLVANERNRQGLLESFLSMSLSRWTGGRKNAAST